MPVLRHQHLRRLMLRRRANAAELTQHPPRGARAGDRHPATRDHLNGHGPRLTHKLEMNAPPPGKQT